MEKSEKIKITVIQLNGLKQFFEVNPNIRVMDLKLMLYEKYDLTVNDVPTIEIKCVYGGNVLNEGRILAFYNIEDGSIINILATLEEYKPIIIGIENPDKTIEHYNIREGTKIRELKKKISESKEIPSNKIELTFKGKVLSVDAIPIAAYVKNGDVLSFNIR